jgi:A/G-specific adenine glycosylase
MRDGKKNRHFCRKLINWYRKHQRALPWRINPTPYKVWISEIMLQQTQTRSVLPYYDRFIKRFPNLESLAHASEQEVLQFWSGLGYYSRARNLHKAAGQILESHKPFPEDFDTILSLPGIGRYTAGAICSIAFDQPYPVVDGNVRRVITRLCGREHIPEGHFWTQMEEWISSVRPSEFNQGMMELGATVCVPLNPRCGKCPVRGLCESNKLGIENSIPSVRTRQAVKRIRIVILVLEKECSLLLTPQNGLDLIPGNWGFPWKPVSDGAEAEECALSLCRAVLGYEARLRPCRPVRHAISNHRITALGLYGGPEERFSGFREGGGFRWVRRSSVRKQLTSSLFVKVLDMADN